MPRLLSLGDFSFSLIFPLSMPILSVFRLILTRYTCFINFREHPLINNLFMFIGEALLGLLIFSSRLNTTIRRESARRLPKTLYIPKTKEISVILPVDHNQRKSNYVLIFLIALCDCVAGLGMFRISFLNNTLPILEYEMRIIQLLYSSLLSSLILHINLYKHQIASIIIYSIGFTLLFIPHVKFNLEFETIGIYALWYSLFNFFSSFLEVIEKYLMQHRYVSEIKLISFEGLMGLCIIFIIIASSYTFKCPENMVFICEDTLTNIINQFKKYPMLFLYSPLYVINLSFTNLWKVLTIKFYSPTHRSISFALVYTIMWIFRICTIKEVTSIQLSLEAIGIVLIICSCLIYNEVIILNFWNCNMNTRQAIIQRGIADTLLCKNLDNDISHSFASKDGSNGIKDQEKQDATNTDIEEKFNDDEITNGVLYAKSEVSNDE